MAIMNMVMLLLASNAMVTQAQSMGAATQAQTNPLKKVITLIEEMKKQVTKEADEDAKGYEKFECWCTSGRTEKTMAVETATKRLDGLAAFMEESTATVGQLKTEIETLTSDIAEDEEALATATGTRNEDNAAFAATEADQKETLAALKDAVATLSKVQLVQKSGGAAPVSLLQVEQMKKMVQRRFPMFQDVMQRDLFDVLSSIAPAAQKKGAAFLAGAGPNYWESSEEQAGKDAKPNDQQGAAAGAKSYNSASGEIFGVLRTMNDQFIRDLSNAQKEEFQALVQYQKLRTAKMEEIAAGKEQKESKEKQLAKLMDEMATAEEDISALEKAKAADEEFLAGLEESCASEKAAYESRVAARADEVKALGEVLKILTDDSARELFGKTMSFLQVKAETSAGAQLMMQDRMQEKAMKRLVAVAKKHQNWALLSVAVRVRLDSFDKVKEMMDKMVADLKTQQQEEYEKNEQCKKDLDQTEDDIKVGQQESKDLDEANLQISNALETLANEISKLQEDVAANEVSLKQSGEARKAENGIFQQTVSDQRATVNILNKAMARLKEFYGFAQVGGLVQIRNHQEPGADFAAAPPKGAAVEKNGASGGLMGTLELVIKDAERVEAAAMADENKAQEEYAKLVIDTKASIEADRDAISLKLEEKAKAEGTKAETEEAQSANSASLQKLTGMLQATHMDCDWLMKYFETRQEARAEEIDAIGQAKAILSGAKFS
jgi:hypothetical protein